ncbi:hypothetical protein BGX28_001488, partial [Mortierella sp. GBA30]
MVSSIPLSYKGEDYPPMSSTVEYIITRFAISGFSFRMSTLQRDLTGFSREFAERYNMGDVIKIEVPVFRTPGGRFNPRNEFVFYTKGTNEANNQQVPRTILLREHQPTPIKVGWNGAPVLCTYCKEEGHFIKTCPVRLSKICSTCDAAGHVSAQCERYGQRDREAEAPPNAAETASTTPTLATQAPTSRSPSPDNHGEFPEINITDQQWQDLNRTEDTSEVEEPSEEESEEDSGEEESENINDMEGILSTNPTSPTSTNNTTTTKEVYQDRAPFTQIPISQTTTIDNSSNPPSSKGGKKKEVKIVNTEKLRRSARINKA